MDHLGAIPHFSFNHTCVAMAHRIMGRYVIFEKGKENKTFKKIFTEKNQKENKNRYT